MSLNRYAYAGANPVNGAVGELMLLNRYAYANGNPVNIVDPSGMYGEQPGDFGGICQQSQQGSGTDCVQSLNPSGVGSIQQLGSPETALYALSGLKLTVACGHTLSWLPYIGSVRQAIRDVEAKIGNFRDIFGNLEFRLGVNNDKKYSADTIGSTLVKWHYPYFHDAPIGGSVPSQNRTWAIVHELGHVLDNRADSSLYYDAQSPTLNQLLSLAYDFSTFMQPQNQRAENVDDVVEKMADAFLFWVYDALDEKTDEGAAARAFAEGGIIVRQKSTNIYKYVQVGAYTPTELADQEDIVQGSNGNLFLGTPKGFLYWINQVRVKRFSLTSN